MTKVSVIVPVYNVEKYLSKCLDSLVNQDFDDYEIIVVNDGSPDNSQSIIDEYSKLYPAKVKAFKKENGGLSSARNYGVERCKGEYVCFVDSDDYVTADYIKMLYEKAINGNFDITICDVMKIEETAQSIILGKKNGFNNDLKTFLISLPNACNKLYKKTLFTSNNIKYPDKIYYEDLATTPRLLLKCNKVGYVNKALYYYVVRTGSITHQEKYNPKTADMFTALSIVTAFFNKNNSYDLYKKELEFLYIFNLLHSYCISIYQYSEGKQGCIKVSEFMKENFPKWKKNKYYKKESLKYKIVCNLIYYKKIRILKLLLNRGKRK